jgi:hypothetical protein
MSRLPAASKSWWRAHVQQIGRAADFHPTNLREAHVIRSPLNMIISGGSGTMLTYALSSPGTVAAAIF